MTAAVKVTGMSRMYNYMTLYGIRIAEWTDYVSIPISNVQLSKDPNFGISSTPSIMTSQGQQGLQDQLFVLVTGANR